MTQEPKRPVVVGVDGSSSAAAAVRVAAVEALALEVPLRVVHAYVWPMFYASLANVPYRPGEWEPAEETKTIVNAVARRLAPEYPDLPVEPAVITGGGGPVLVDESLRASLVVVGARGARGLAGMLGGSVAAHVAAHAHCPALVVPEGRTIATTDGPVTVGVDGTERSLDALWYACAWATPRGIGVDAIYSVDGRHADDPERRLDAWVDAVRGESPNAQIRAIVAREETATDVLLRASQTARMVVVGSRERSDVMSLALGSVGHALVRRSACPVAVVHGWTRQTTPALSPSAPRHVVLR